jgi:hypothetical protein
MDVANCHKISLVTVARFFENKWSKDQVSFHFKKIDVIIFFINTFMGSIESFLSPMKILNTHMHVLAIPMICIPITYHNAKFKLYKFWCMEYITPYQLPPQKLYSICACDSLLIFSYLVESFHSIL